MAAILQSLNPMLATPSQTMDTHVPAQGVNARREVAVIIAAWRASATIGQAVATALGQRETAEVIVVDDCSNDEGATLAAAQAADDGTGRLKIIALDRNSGPSHARNVAIAASRAPWIAVLDSDDFMEPGRFAALLALAHEGYDLIADDLMQTPEGKPVSEGRPLWFRGDSTPIDVDFSLFIGSNIPRADRHRSELGFLKPLMRRTFLERHELGYNEAMRLGEDYDLYARALSLGARMRLVPYAGYVSIWRANSLSATRSRADLLAFEAADDRLLASDRLKPTEKWLVRDHRFTTRSRILWIDVIDLLKAGKPFRALSIVLRDPRQAPYVLRGLWKILVRRFTGAKKS
jgi:succinoglycan biosynthesis protein ExoU